MQYIYIVQYLWSAESAQHAHIASRGALFSLFPSLNWRPHATRFLFPRGTPMCQQSRAQMRPLWPHAATCLISSYSSSLCQRKVRNDPVLRVGVADRPALPIVALLSTFPSLASSRPQQQPEALETSQNLGIPAIYKPPPTQTAAIEASLTLRTAAVEASQHVQTTARDDPPPLQTAARDDYQCLQTPEMDAPQPLHSVERHDQRLQTAATRPSQPMHSVARDKPQTLQSTEMEASQSPKTAARDDLLPLQPAAREGQPLPGAAREASKALRSTISRARDNPQHLQAAARKDSK
jgi:hypothetical protein